MRALRCRFLRAFNVMLRTLPVLALHALLHEDSTLNVPVIAVRSADCVACLRPIARHIKAACRDTQSYSSRTLLQFLCVAWSRRNRERVRGAGVGDIFRKIRKFMTATSVATCDTETGQCVNECVDISPLNDYC